MENNEKKHTFETLIGEYVETAMVAAAPSAGRIVAAALTAVATAAGSEYFLDCYRTYRIACANGWRTVREAARAFAENGGLVAVLEFRDAVSMARRAIRALPKETRDELLQKYVSRFPLEGLKRETGKWEQEGEKLNKFLADPFELRPVAAPAPAEVPTPDEIN